MCPLYAEMDVIFGHKPNLTPIASYDLQDKDSFNVDDDVDVFLYKENNGLESPLNLVPFLHNEDDLVQAENLQDESKSKSITHSTQKCNQALTPNLNDKSGSRKRPMDMFAPAYANLLESWQKVKMLIWSGKERGGMKRKQQFEEVKLQKQMEFDKKQHAKKQEFKKEEWNYIFSICSSTSNCTPTAPSITPVTSTPSSTPPSPYPFHSTHHSPWNLPQMLLGGSRH
ncbi:hypothetical protein O181_107889 [Austropuccinia psidii MF-1]|uniref:Uncharacterized protein n=1 Tax=Austropuccinia psidii MF-1 TaxID=1389203 RepID=A0A9Q3PNG0_9BASI|nr:hypothetical protein [Austropuccinia psidii MF-1]